MTNRVRDLSNLRLSQLEKDDIVYCHLSFRSHEMTKDFVVVSSLEAAATEMTQARGTDLTANYAPLLTGFAILDQIGSCYENATMAPHPTGGAAIERALYYFGGMAARSPEVEHLYALRNGLVHDASLTSHDRPKRKWYMFRFNRNMPDVIRLPAQDWDGNAGSLGPDTTTWINPRRLTEIISNAISDLRDLRELNSGALTVLKPKEEILHKYLFWEKR